MIKEASWIIYTTFLYSLTGNTLEIIVIIWTMIILILMCLYRFLKIDKSKLFNLGFLLLYTSFLLFFLVIGREKRTTRDFDLIPFHSYIVLFSDYSLRHVLELVMNIAMFIPFGYYLVKLNKVMRFRTFQVVLIGVFISMIFETMQYVFNRGLLEVDDIVNNSLGFFLGVQIGKGKIDNDKEL